ncbi:catechol 2,3-dioxygenase-like lactoylglutathione lyase family enzyme [Rhizobium fabae]|uniref:Catechol 2,3-dioxygenase-like lactoylglutathione lyase family enzyme n=1 Tax=Rhizobium fabae TaxID=573179 RepID=A0A7W6B6D1_9HYPH|nr:catechol 2,3-dioxygenase-like lactoylglutathione lyase family enzyme [Rhizobium fabae]
MQLNGIEVITLFVDNIDDAKSFYQKVFACEAVYQDAVSSVLNRGGDGQSAGGHASASTGRAIGGGSARFRRARSADDQGR